MEPADRMTADMIYERRWALTVLERVLSQLKDEYGSAGNAALFDSLKQLLPDEPGLSVTGGDRCAFRDDRKCSEVGVL